jgi:conjugative transposon TraN protein
MKMFIIYLITTILFTAANAQIKVVPSAMNRPTDTLYIGYYVTTSLVFDATVWRADGGSKDIIFQKQPGITNVLNVKGNRRDFMPTNLHVYTGDGKLFTFLVIYSPTPVITTLFIRDLPTAKAPLETHSHLPFSHDLLNEEQLQSFIESSRTALPFLSRMSRANQIIAKLRTLHYVQDLLFLSIEIINQSTLPYDIEFIRMYVQDKEKIKRSTVQQREVIPVYKDLYKNVSIGKPQRYVIVIPKFTLGDNKQFYLEIFERNGGRNLAMQIKNRHLLRAKSFYYGDQK